jgi:hypothetical protein
MALLISALPLAPSAKSALRLNEGDFKVSERVTKEGERVLKYKLTKSGKAKVKKINTNK